MLPIDQLRLDICSNNADRALAALRKCLHQEELKEKQRLLWQIMPEIELEIIRRTCLIYLGYLGSELATHHLKELGHQKLDVISMGVIVALANLDDRSSIQTLATALHDGDPVLHAQVLACAENCSQFQRFKSALELQRHLEDRAGEGTGDSVGDNSS